MKPLFIIICFLVSHLMYPNEKLDSVLNVLQEVIDNKDFYVQKQIERNQNLKNDFTNYRDHFFTAYYILDTLVYEYQSFKFDSAYKYNKMLIEMAYGLKDPDKIAHSKTAMANILISTGMFHAAIDTLKSINVQNLSKVEKFRYFTVLSRCYFDLESFSPNGYYSYSYKEKGLAAYDSALIYLDSNSWQYDALQAQKHIKTGENNLALNLLNKILETHRIKNEDLGSLEMSLAFLYYMQGLKDDALIHMTNASIADFISAKKEAVALLFVANYLFERGNVIKASNYINLAVDDSHFYGSGFRLWQTAQYLSMIKSKHIVTIEYQKKELLKYLIIVSILTLIILFSVFIIYTQYKKLKHNKLIIEKKNAELAKINEELTVVNKLKEEYIGYYFSVNTQLLNKMEQFKQSLSNKFIKRQYQEMQYELSRINILNEKETLYKNFDSVFLNIYPDFTKKFNLLLREDEKIMPKEGQLLNTELRIFALIRLGIHDSEKISRILDYSVNTIYTYKTKVKNKSDIPNDNFENEVMKIKHF